MNTPLEVRDSVLNASDIDQMTSDIVRIRLDPAENQGLPTASATVAEGFRELGLIGDSYRFALESWNTYNGSRRNGYLLSSSNPASRDTAVSLFRRIVQGNLETMNDLASEFGPKSVSTLFREDQLWNLGRYDPKQLAEQSQMTPAQRSAVKHLGVFARTDHNGASVFSTSLTTMVSRGFDVPIEKCRLVEVAYANMLDTLTTGIHPKGMLNSFGIVAHGNGEKAGLSREGSLSGIDAAKLEVIGNLAFQGDVFVASCHSDWPSSPANWIRSARPDLNVHSFQGSVSRVIVDAERRTVLQVQ